MEEWVTFSAKPPVRKSYTVGVNLTWGWHVLVLVTRRGPIARSPTGFDPDTNTCQAALSSAGAD
jgi:hypothetical protein